MVASLRFICDIIDRSKEAVLQPGSLHRSFMSVSITLS